MNVIQHVSSAQRTATLTEERTGSDFAKLRYISLVCLRIRCFFHQRRRFLQMVSGYRTHDDTVTQLLNQYNFYFIPVMNPDGYTFSWEEERFWRKSRNVNSFTTCMGTDLNRNYDAYWRGLCLQVVIFDMYVFNNIVSLTMEFCGRSRLNTWPDLVIVREPLLTQ